MTQVLKKKEIGISIQTKTKVDIHIDIPRKNTFTSSNIQNKHAYI